MSIKKLFVFLVIVSFITSLSVSLVSFGKVNDTVTVEVPFSEQRTSKEKIDIVLSAKNFEEGDGKFIHSVMLFSSKYNVTIEDVEIRYRYNNLNGLSAILPGSLYYYLKCSPYVLAISEVVVSEKSGLYDDFLDWGVDTVNAERAWGGSEDATSISSSPKATGDGIRLGLLDTGLNMNHEDLDGNYIGGWDVADEDEVPEPYEITNSHGTRMAGIICAEDNGLNTIGVAPEVDLYGISLNFNYFDEILAALEWVLDPFNSTHPSIYEPMQILSMSWGFPLLSGVIHEIVLLAMQKVYREDIVLVAAMGNSNKDHSITVPGAMEESISVGSIERDTSHSGYYSRWVSSSYSGSNYGDWLDVVAPGGDGDILTTKGTGSVTYSGRTSAATAHVAGVVALMLEVNPDLTPGEIKWLLKESANNDFIWDYNSHEYGVGIVDANEAVIQVQNYVATDSDNDGLPDKQEIIDGTDPYDSDSDNDGLTDYEEFYHETYFLDATNADTDGDNLGDGWEIDVGFDPTVTTSSVADPDDDGLNNLQEFQLGTDPNDSDTDDDLILDSDEFDWGLNPLVASDADADYDSDGLTNLEEINGWFDDNGDGDYLDSGEKSYYKTNPYEEDTDGDGFDDYEEQHPHRGPPTDPTDPTDPTGGFFP